MSAAPPIKITLADVQAELERRSYRKYDYYFPDSTRAGYQKHLDFIAATADCREVCFMAGNRTGKSETGAYAVTAWATGEYPHWWTGRRFNRAVSIIVAGETGRLVRDSLQMKLLGLPGQRGTGMIPRDAIVSVSAKSGVPDAIDTIQVRNKYGGVSIIHFQSFDQGREQFQATSRDVVWLDEEPPLAVYEECLVRTMTTKGVVILTFTPLKGMSDTVQRDQPKAQVVEDWTLNKAYTIR